MQETNKPGSGFLLIGTYTSPGGSKGIYVYRCDYGAGTFEYKGYAEAENPSYIAFGKDERFVYAVSEQAPPSFVNAIGFDPGSGRVHPVNRSRGDGAGMCNIVVSPDGKYVITSNYSSGGVSVFPIADNGSVGPEVQHISYSGLGPLTDRQEASHIHCARYCRCGKYLFVTDLGNDALYRYNVSPDGPDYIDESSFKEFKMAPGSGPRHFVFDREGNYMYLANELSASVTVFRFTKGEITQVQSIAASRTGSGDGADIKLSPDGRFAYMSIRENGDDGIAIYSRDASTGLLKAIGYQPCVEHPRNIEFSPGGRFLFVAGMKANKVQVFECMPDGSLRDTGCRLDVPSPTCLIFTGGEL